MALLHDHLPGLTLEHLRLGATPTPVRRLDEDLVPGVEVWLKDESRFGDGGWGGNKVRKLEWIIPEAHRRGVRTLFTVGGIGTHWGLAAALYGRDHGLRTLLGLVDQPVDDHVREQLTRLEASGAELHRYRDPRRLKLAAPWLVARTTLRDRRMPWYLPAGGSNPFGATAYVDAALEIAGQVQAGAPSRAGQRRHRGRVRWHRGRSRPRAAAGRTAHPGLRGGGQRHLPARCTGDRGPRQPDRRPAARTRRLDRPGTPASPST